MKYSVIKEDQAIYIDQVSFNGIDLSDTKPFHAFQYNTEFGGEIEFEEKNELLNSDSDIKTKTGISLTEYKKRWDKAKLEYENDPLRKNPEIMPGQ
jgi:hypothetical protein|tara:strand:+ start:59 stop:346 length:288 start_codon:yes stop_codon:yes gene_type:complete